MSNRLFEYTDFNIDGDRIVMAEVRNQTGLSFQIGNRFSVMVKTSDSELAFDFFRNYCPMLGLSEIKKGWLSYQKARRQRSDNLVSAFWNYFEGNKIKRIDRKGGAFQWVSN